MKKLLNIGDRYIENSNCGTIALLKFCLLALGVLLGLEVPKKHKNTARIVAGGVFVATYIPLIVKLVCTVKEMCCCAEEDGEVEEPAEAAAAAQTEEPAAAAAAAEPVEETEVAEAEETAEETEAGEEAEAAEAEQSAEEESGEVPETEE